MRYINNLEQNISTFTALSSPLRIQIIKLLHDNIELNLNDIAKKLHVTNGALTPHIKLLQESGLINVRLMPLPKGTQKLCSLSEDKLIIELYNKSNDLPCYDLELNVGQYSDFKVNAPCGLASHEAIIGGYDSNIYFSYPDRFSAEAVWFTDGYITYTFPYILKINQVLKEIQFTFEISSEAPGASMDYPSIIDIYINDVKLGSDYLPGERFDRRGKLTPAWWKNNFGQYGWLKLYTINEEGTFFSGQKISDIKVSDLKFEETGLINLKISCQDRKETKGGVTIFGRQFGDQEQGIKLKLVYDIKD